MSAKAGRLRRLKMETRPHWALVALVAVALSVLAMLVAFLVRISLHQTPYFIFLPGVMIAAWYGGRLGGLLATLASLVLIDYYVLEPHYSFLARDVAGRGPGLALRHRRGERRDAHRRAGARRSSSAKRRSATPRKRGSMRKRAAG